MEREARRDQARAQLTGLALADDLELDPANCLIQKFVDMLGQRTVWHVDWQECPKRAQETTGARKPKTDGINTDGNGYLRSEKKSDEPLVSNADQEDCMKVQNLFRRRHLALHIAGLGTFQAADKITLALFKAMNRKPPSPGFVSPGLDELRSADRLIWELVA